MNTFAGAAFKGEAGEAESGMPGVISVFPRETNLRMLVQRANFTIHNVLQPLEELHGAKDCLLKATIPAERKAELLDNLKSLGIDEPALFPDLEQMSAGLAESELPRTPTDS